MILKFKTIMTVSDAIEFLDKYPVMMRYLADKWDADVMSILLDVGGTTAVARFVKMLNHAPYYKSDLKIVSTVLDSWDGYYICEQEKSGIDESRKYAHDIKIATPIIIKRPALLYQPGTTYPDEHYRAASTVSTAIGLKTYSNYPSIDAMRHEYMQVRQQQLDKYMLEQWTQWLSAPPEVAPPIAPGPSSPPEPISLPFTVPVKGLKVE